MILVSLIGALVYLTGGTKHAYLHLMYLPIILAAFLWERPGGALIGLGAGLLMGPWMPVDTAAGVAQSTLSWMVRAASFAAIGLAAGYTQSLLSRRLQEVEGSMAELSAIHARLLSAFAGTVALRDEQTGGHCERVAHSATAMGRALGLESHQLTELHWAGLLHDLGKISVPEQILLKPGRLTSDEYEAVKLHSDIGADMLESISSVMRPIAEGVRGHHERWDGAGYPRGLEGESIPLFGRILAVADVFEALTSQRPYREPLPPHEAVAYLQENAGTHFDPSLVRLFVHLYDEGKIFVSGDPGFTTVPVAPIEIHRQAM